MAATEESTVGAAGGVVTGTKAEDGPLPPRLADGSAEAVPLITLVYTGMSLLTFPIFLPAEAFPLLLEDSAISEGPGVTTRETKNTKETKIKDKQEKKKRRTNATITELTSSDARNTSTNTLDGENTPRKSPRTKNSIQAIARPRRKRPAFPMSH